MPRTRTRTQAIQSTRFSHVQDILGHAACRTEMNPGKEVTPRAPTLIVIPSTRISFVSTLDLARGCDPFPGSVSLPRRSARCPCALTGVLWSARRGCHHARWRNGARQCSLVARLPSLGTADCAVFRFFYPRGRRLQLADALNNATFSRDRHLRDCARHDEFDRAFWFGSAAVLLANLNTPPRRALLMCSNPKKLEPRCCAMSVQVLKLLLEELP